MNCYVIMRNIIIKSERDTPAIDDQPFNHDGPLAQLAQVLAEFAAFLAMHQDLLEHE
jgi:hypothetical protein